MSLFLQASGKNQKTNPLNGMSKQQAKAWIYKNVAHWTRGIYRDQYWSPVQKIWGVFNDAGVPFTINESQYIKDPAQSDMPIGKVWKFEVEFVDKNQRKSKLYGSLTAAGAGSVKDPLDKYDVNVVLGATMLEAVLPKDHKGRPLLKRVQDALRNVLNRWRRQSVKNDQNAVEEVSRAAVEAARNLLKIPKQNVIDEFDPTRFDHNRKKLSTGAARHVLRMKNRDERSMIFQVPVKARNQDYISLLRVFGVNGEEVEAYFWSFVPYVDQETGEMGYRLKVPPTMISTSNQLQRYVLPQLWDAEIPVTERPKMTYKQLERAYERSTDKEERRQLMKQILDFGKSETPRSETDLWREIQKETNPKKRKRLEQKLLKRELDNTLVREDDDEFTLEDLEEYIPPDER